MRKDFLHKLSKSYSENQTVVVEAQTCLVIDNEMKLKDASCDCWYFGQNKLNKGPCEHILATSSFWRSRR